MSSRRIVVLLAALLCGCGSKSKSKSTALPPVPTSPSSAPDAAAEVSWRVAFFTRHDRDRPVPASDSVELVLASDPSRNLLEERHIKGGRMHNFDPVLVGDDLSRRVELAALLPRISKENTKASRTYALGRTNDRRWKCMPSIPILPSDGLTHSIVIESASPETKTKLDFVWDDAAERPSPDVARLLELVEELVKTESVSCRRP